MTTPGQHRKDTGAATTRAAGLMALVTIGALLVQWTANLSRERIARNEAAQIMKVLNTLLPTGSYDNHPDQDRIMATDAALLGSAAAQPVYRARAGGVPVAAVLTVIGRPGYVGPIRLLVAIAPTGTVLAVHVTAHTETPGLGDAIDSRRSDWTGQFAGRSLASPPLQQWAVRRDGGSFDQITGATITSRAVVSAVRDAAIYFDLHKADIFSRPAELQSAESRRLATIAD